MFNSKLVYRSFSKETSVNYLGEDKESGGSHLSSPLKAKQNSLLKSSVDPCMRPSMQFYEKIAAIEDLPYFEPQKFNINQGELIDMIVYNSLYQEYEFTNRASEIFMKYKGYAAIVSIFGEKYSGKSYLMNSLMGLDQKEGFPLNHEKNSNKFGVYLYSEPHYYEKENLYIFFIDCTLNGCTQEQISAIFSLINLISSYLMINCFGDINEANLKHMIQTCSLPENLSLATEEKESESNNDFLPYYLTKVLWIFRDYAIFDKENKQILASKYQQLHSFLNEIKTTHKINQHIKNYILDFYKDLDCIMVCKPDFDSNGGNKWEYVMNCIREKIFQKIAPKNINGYLLNSRMLCSLIHSFIEEINDNYVPNITNAVDYFIENECIVGYNEGIDKYHQTLKTDIHIEEVKSMFHLSNILKEIKDETLDVYYSYALFAEKTKYFSYYKNKLKKFIDEKENLAFQSNEKLSEDYALEEYHNNFDSLKKSLESGNYSLKNYKTFINEFNESLDKFSNNSIGEKKLKILSENIISFQETSFACFIGALQNERSHHKLDEELQKRKKFYEEKEKELLRNKTNLENAYSKTQEKNKDVEIELNKVREDYKKYEKVVEEHKELNEKKSLQILEAKKIYDYHPKKLNELNLKRQELHEERAKHSKKKKCCGK